MAAAKRTGSVQFGVPGLGKQDAGVVIEILQDRLNALSDLALTLKHVHWNVVGPVIAVHTMLDPQVDAVRSWSTTTAERIATLGGSPSAPPALFARAAGMTTPSAAPTPRAPRRPGRRLRRDHRSPPPSDRDTEDPDPVTRTSSSPSRPARTVPLVRRAHLEDPSGSLATSGARTEEAGRGPHPQEVGPVQRPGTERAAERPAGPLAGPLSGPPAALLNYPPAIQTVITGKARLFPLNPAATEPAGAGRVTQAGAAGPPERHFPRRPWSATASSPPSRSCSSC